MAFVRDVVRGRGRSLEEAAMRVFDPKPRDGDMKPPLSGEELRARQDRFYADAHLRIEREAPDRGRKRLVFVQCGKGFDASYLAAPRDYDVLLNYYQPADANPRADAVVHQAGTKTTAIRRLLDERPGPAPALRGGLSFSTTTSKSPIAISARCSRRRRARVSTSPSRP